MRCVRGTKNSVLDSVVGQLGFEKAVFFVFCLRYHNKGGTVQLVPRGTS